MKKMISFALALIMVLVLVACGDNTVLLLTTTGVLLL